MISIPAVVRRILFLSLLLHHLVSFCCTVHVRKGNRIRPLSTLATDAVMSLGSHTGKCLCRIFPTLYHSGTGCDVNQSSPLVDEMRGPKVCGMTGDGLVDPFGLAGQFVATTVDSPRQKRDLDSSASKDDGGKFSVELEADGRTLNMMKLKMAKKASEKRQGGSMDPASNTFCWQVPERGVWR